MGASIRSKSRPAKRRLRGGQYREMGPNPAGLRASRGSMKFGVADSGSRTDGIVGTSDGALEDNRHPLERTNRGGCAFHGRGPVPEHVKCLVEHRALPRNTARRTEAAGTARPGGAYAWPTSVTSTFGRSQARNRSPRGLRARGSCRTGGRSQKLRRPDRPREPLVDERKRDLRDDDRVERSAETKSQGATGHVFRDGRNVDGPGRVHPAHGASGGGGGSAVSRSTRPCAWI